MNNIDSLINGYNATYNKKLENFKSMPEEDLLTAYDKAVADKSTDVEIIEEAIANYHFCDVCGSSYPMDEPCELH